MERENQNVGEAALGMPDVLRPIWELLVAKEQTTAPAPDDLGQLTAKMAGGDEDAFREFYGRYFNRLYGYLLVVSRGRDDAAREALQLAMLRVVRHVRRFESEAVFWNWLTVLARTAFIDEQRKRGRYLALLQRFVRRVPETRPDAGEAEEHLRWCLNEAMTRLERDEGDLIERKYLKGESVAEIAVAVNVTPKAIESRLTRARQKLKQQILALLNDESV